MNVSSAPQNATIPKYSALTVPQLKALCKEKKLAGYSKLGKAALIEKLAAYGSQTSTVPTTRTAPATSSSEFSSLSGGTTSRLDVVQPTPISNPILVVSSSSETQQMDEVSVQNNLEPNRRSGGLMASFADSVSGHSVESSAAVQELEERRFFRGEGVISPTPPCNNVQETQSHDPSTKVRGVAKRGREDLDRSLKKANKKTRPYSTTRTLPAVQTPSKGQQDTPQFSGQVSKHRGTVDARASNISDAPSRPDAQTTKETSARFKPLSVSLSGHKTTTPNGDVLHSPSQGNGFNHPPQPLPELRQIILPPLTGEIKQAQKWAIMLSGIRNEERSVCAVVSKTIRYAIYLSAVDILSRDFNGRRFAKLLQQYPSSTTNFWPYLRLRQRERETQLRLYQQSCLGSFFGGRTPIAQSLWASPDYENQAAIAMRFSLTRVWFSLSVLGDREECLRMSVTDAREVIKDEVWCVDVATLDLDGNESRNESFYILEETCEVIGRPTSPGSEESTRHLQALRVDWSDYVQFRLLPAGFHSTPPEALCSHLKWTNAEEYDKGISKIWLKRIVNEGSLGLYKRRIAERYVLACVAGNSVSGEWMSASRMQQEFAGDASVPDHSTRKREKLRVNLFLPSHHLVESVHFKTACGESLHKDLAVVQTPNREYYILRNNGMEVGCEEDGVWGVWREMLNCDGRGLAS